MPIAWITGGSKRIGRGLALRLAAHGYDIGLSYHHSEEDGLHTAKEIELLGRKCLALKCNVTDKIQVNNVLSQWEGELGLATVVISNAGIFPAPRTAEELWVEEIEQTISVNTLPLATITQRYYSSCKLSDTTGRVICIGSLGADEIWKNMASYNVSKSALQTLAHSLARSCAPVLAINTVAPGSIVQPGEETEHDKSLVPVTRIPMQRHGTVDDLFDAVWFFCTASTYITGQTITVDGGYRFVR